MTPENTEAPEASPIMSREESIEYFKVASNLDYLPSHRRQAARHLKDGFLAALARNEELESMRLPPEWGSYTKDPPPDNIGNIDYLYSTLHPDSTCRTLMLAASESHKTGNNGEILIFPLSSAVGVALDKVVETIDPASVIAWRHRPQNAARDAKKETPK